MNIDLKFGNREFIYILIIIVLLSLLFSCNDYWSMMEGMTNDGNYNACNIPPYGDNSEGMWYDPSCGSMKNYSYAILPSFTDAITHDTSSVECSSITGEKEFNNLFKNNNSGYNAYYYDTTNNSIQLIQIKSIQSPTIIFNCTGTTDKINIPSIKASPITLDFKNGNITQLLANQSSVKIYKYPDDFQDLTPTNPINIPQSQNQNMNMNANMNENSVNVNVDTNMPASALNPRSNNSTNTTNTTNIVNPTTGSYMPGQMFNNPSLGFQPPINTIISSETVQPSVMSNMQQGWSNLFGQENMNGSNSMLQMNNLSDLNPDGSTPSTLFTTPDGRQGIATSQNTINGIPPSQIPQGQEDLYILKSQVVPPVCPACPPVIVDKNSLSQDCPPCPPCARCPEPSFDCKKVPNYSLGPENSFLPRPVLNNFSTFGT